MNTKTRKQRVHDCTNTKARKEKGAYKHSDKQAKEYIPTLRHTSKRVCTNTKTEGKEYTQTLRHTNKRAYTNAKAIKQRLYTSTKTSTAKEYIQCKP